MSIHHAGEDVHKIRWREGGRNKSLTVHGPRALAKKILRKKLSARDENRHLDVKKEVNFRMSALIDRYWQQYGIQKKSRDREKHIVDGIGQALGHLFVREVDGTAVDGWYQKLTAEQGLSPGTAVRHFNVMHHMMGKAATIWSKETGIDRNPADQVEVKRPNDQREPCGGRDSGAQGLPGPEDVSERKQRHQPDVLPLAADRADCAHHGDADCGNLWPEVA